MPVPLRLLLADDHAVLRAGLRALLERERDMTVVGEAADGSEALCRARGLHPDVVIMDLAMPAGGGVEATRRIRAELPDVRVLILSQHDDESYLRSALAAGAAGFALKRAADSELLAAIRAVAGGGLYLHPSLTRAMIDELLERRTGDAPSAADPLSDREREVLQLVAQGYANHEVAERLALSVKTVETYRARITEKTGLRSRAELYRYARDRGLLDA
ncbi:MAG: response regulator transcription factor [Chloroflexota bacterium]|nr:response regulator transcription factor [Chloroflexota bacterium]MDE3193952.1 response regulator transcription factor [Chloroflexota bacterium]